VTPEDREAARLLRELAASPRQAIIWPLHHGRWSTNILDAFQRGQTALKAAGRPSPASRLAWLADHAGCTVSAVLQAREWPPDTAVALLDAANALVPTDGATV
jgi:hypothetical protein